MVCILPQKFMHEHGINFPLGSSNWLNWNSQSCCFVAEIFITAAVFKISAKRYVTPFLWVIRVSLPHKSSTLCPLNWTAYSREFRFWYIQIHFWCFLGLEGTDSTTLQRNNTFTTYITLNRKNRLSTYQSGAAKASSMTRASQNTNGTSNGRRKKNMKDVMDEPI